MRDVLFFDNMLTPKIITLVYWLMLLSAIVSGLGLMFGGYGGFGMSKLLAGLAAMIGGAVASRIFCELMIVAFKMNEALQEMRKK